MNGSTLKSCTLRLHDQAHLVHVTYTKIEMRPKRLGVGFNACSHSASWRLRRDWISRTIGPWHA